MWYNLISIKTGLFSYDKYNAIDGAVDFYLERFCFYSLRHTHVYLTLLFSRGFFLISLSDPFFTVKRQC